uniref:DRBM domain-containing protein n=1 Tax=Panagrellus redivivus TaxID=6233 RepID=A0A7E4UXJ3_PANRE
MEKKTLITILNEGMAKMHVVPITNSAEAPGTTFKTSIAIILPDGPKFEGVGIGPKKKLSQHIAAGKLMLKLLEDDSLWINFPYFEKMVEKRLAVESIQTLLDNIASEHGETSDNPIGSLITMCRQKALPQPIFTCDDDTANALPQHSRIFHVTCAIDSYETTGEAASKRNARARAADAMLKIIADIVPKERNTTQECNNFSLALPPVSTSLNAPKVAVKEIPGISERDVFHLMDMMEYLLNTPDTNNIIREVQLLKQKGRFEFIGKFEFMCFRHKSTAESFVLISLHAVNPKVEKFEDAEASDVYASFNGSGVGEKEACVDAYKSFLHYVRNFYTYELGYNITELKKKYNPPKTGSRGLPTRAPVSSEA